VNIPDNHDLTAVGPLIHPPLQKKFPKINFSCQNVCSLNISKPGKKMYSKLAAVVKNGSDIILLRDTRLNSDKQIAGVNDIEKKLKFLDYSIIHNSTILTVGEQQYSFPTN
jgi:hypothetical protein